MAAPKAAAGKQPAASPQQTPFGFYLFMGSVAVAILAMIVAIFLT